MPLLVNILNIRFFKKKQCYNVRDSAGSLPKNIGLGDKRRNEKE